MSAMKPGEVKYCGVTFSEDGKQYHYRTTDLRIDVGDVVIVPVGENNYEREGAVKTVEFCRWDDTPYPLEKTKQILRRAGDPVEKPLRIEAADEGVEVDDEEGGLYSGSDAAEE